jgi:predicted thioesterase
LISNIKPGIENKLTREVTQNDTASSFGVEHMPVLATSKIVAFMEYTALSSIQSYLPEGYSSVGTHITIYHEKPALPGENVTCVSRLVEAEGRKLVFEITIHNDHDLVARATHTRMIIKNDAFRRLIQHSDGN